jgi:hypothetical protein
VPTIITRGASSAQALGYAFSSAEPANYVEDVFSTYLYTGSGSTQTINNGIDLSGKGGLVWIKTRNFAVSNIVADTERGADRLLFTNLTSASSDYTSKNGITAFNSDGFSLGSDTDGLVNYSGATYASWTFRKQPKFFDIVTFTSSSSGGATFNHFLDAIPGFVVIKSLSSVSTWRVYHRSLSGSGANQYMDLNSTAAASNFTGVWPSATSTSFTAADGILNNSQTYVAYLFAHDAGGFGLTGTDNVISCGSYVGTGATGNNVTLGYEPQWLMIKAAERAQDWFMFDNMRGMAATGGTQEYLLANTSEAAGSGAFGINPTATGFGVNTAGTSFNASGETYIYIAIRRGPMKVPTVGTEVYNGIARTGTGAAATVTGVGFAPDFVQVKSRSVGTRNWIQQDRLRGTSVFLSSNLPEGDVASSAAITGFDEMNGVRVGISAGLNAASETYINHFFRRAPGFFDEVCYTGTGVARTVAHNLAAVPELMIVKSRSSPYSWTIYPLDATKYMEFSTSGVGAASIVWNDTAPTASVFTVGTALQLNQSGSTFVAYLFATCPGVSKVGLYTGTGTTLQINCGFTAGARFVLIKRTDSTGDWYVWDSARGIVAGNDPYLLLNRTDAEVTNTDYVDTFSSGFEIISTAPAAINASGGSFIFLAIA